MGTLSALSIIVVLFLAVVLALARKVERPPSAAPAPRSSLGGCLGCVGALTLIAGAFIIGGFFLTALSVGTVAHKVAEGGKSAPSLIVEVATFLELHHEFGRPTSTIDIADWAHGKRQRVNFDSGRSLLFYAKDGDVVTIYEDTPTQGLQKVWGEYASYEAGTPDPPSTSRGNIPLYEQIDQGYRDRAYRRALEEKERKQREGDEEKAETARAEEAVRQKEEEAVRQEEAVESAERGRRQQAEAERQVQVIRAERLMSMAEDLESMKKTRGALDFYRKVVAECPDAPQATTAAGRIKALAGR